MKYPLETLINIILSKSEQMEEEIKNHSEIRELTYKQLHCLEAVKEMHNPTLTELAGKLQITKPSASVIVDKLVQKGYLVKIHSDHDRRSAHVHITPRGETASLIHEKVHHSFAGLLAQNLSDEEKEMLIVLLNKAITNLT